MLVETHVDYDITYRKKGTRKIVKDRFIAPTTVDIPDFDGRDLPVSVWTSPVDPHWGRFPHHGSEALKVGLRKVGDDFLRPVFRSTQRAFGGRDKVHAVDPAFVRNWKGRRLSDAKAEAPLATAADLSDPFLTVGPFLGDVGQADRRSGRCWDLEAGQVTVGSPGPDVVFDMRHSGLQDAMAALADDLRTRFAVVDGVLHERIPPFFAFLGHYDRKVATVRGQVVKSEGMAAIGRARCLWFPDTQKAIKEDVGKSYDRESVLLHTACVVERQEAYEVDERAEIASSLAASLASCIKDPGVFLTDRPEFLRAVLGFRDQVAEGGDPADALSLVSEICGVLPERDYRNDDGQSTVQRSVLSALAAFATRFPPSPARTPQAPEFRP